MDNYGGFLLLIDEMQRAKAISDDIERYGTFTDTMSAPDWKISQVDISLVSLGEESIHFAALVHRGRNVATRKFQIRFSNIIHFEPSVPLSEIEKKFRPQIKTHFIRSSSGIGGNVPPATWDDLIQIIKQLRPRNTQDLDRLENLRRFKPEDFAEPGFEIIAHERDAINIALRISGFNHIAITEWLPTEGYIAPFLTGLRSAKLIEDQMINHDAQVFGNWKKIMEFQVGANVFINGTERLTILNVNRHPIEHTLGVDLLYYFHKHKSYVMVQYKRMIKEGKENEYGYRPIGKSYQDELCKMLSFAEILDNTQHQISPSEYRFHSGMFYFKLCPADIFEPTSTEMIRGMYLPLDYWAILVDSPSILGSKGGKRITFNNVERYFNNTIFIELVESGWIGSQITDNGFITEVIQAALENKRSVILASLQSN